jgi:CRP/FNR family transcriptional regulator, nitrogen oxide reductase regulator
VDVKAKARAEMTSSQAAAILTRLKPRLLEGLSSAEVESMLASASIRRFAANCVITNEGDSAEHLFLTLDGSVRGFTASPQGAKIVLRWVRPGEVIGWATLMSKPMEYIVSTEAVKNSAALVWDRAGIRSLAAAYPRLLENALLLAYDYLILYRMLHIAASCQSAPQRLAQVLCDLAKGMGRSVSGGVELQVRNEELANEANVTIFTVSRLMGEWQRKGLLTKSRGKVVLRLPEELIRIEA